MVLYRILPSVKNLSKSPGENWRYGQVNLAGITLYFYFHMCYVLSCNTTLEVMAVGWQLPSQIAFAGLSTPQDTIDP